MELAFKEIEIVINAFEMKLIDGWLTEPEKELLARLKSRLKELDVE